MEEKKPKQLERHLEEHEVNRRNFLKSGLVATAALGLTGMAGDALAKEVEKASSKRVAERVKIDVFNHILPKKYYDALCKKLSADTFAGRMVRMYPALIDLEQRFRVMDKFPGLQQVLTLSTPPIEAFADKSEAVDFVKLANDGMAELVLKYPDRFLAAVGSLPMNNIDAALKEVDRTIIDLKFRGVQLITPINDKPLDSAELMPLYEKMARFNLPIWIHPWREPDYADYRSESRSKYFIFWTFGWPYETTVAMSRLVYSGVLERYLNLKFITHHCGGMVPYYHSRLVDPSNAGSPISKKKSPIEYFKMFYADTAVGRSPTLTCGYKFFGADHMLFGTDMPFDFTFGGTVTRDSINAIEEMDITEVDKKKIFEDNVRSLLLLPV